LIARRNAVQSERRVLADGLPKPIGVFAMAVVRDEEISVQLHPQFLVDEAQQPTAVLLPIAEWKLLLEQLEDLEDIRAYDAAKAKPMEFVDFEEAVERIEANEAK
jgi:hypothetical protein